MAVIATKGAKADLRRRIDRVRPKAEKKHQEDLAKAEKVTQLGLMVLEANAGDTGKLYGTITTKQLATSRKKTRASNERRNVNVDRPISKVGEYTVYVKFSPKCPPRSNCK